MLDPMMSDLDLEFWKIVFTTWYWDEVEAMASYANEVEKTIKW